MSDPVLSERDGGVLTLTLNPERRNAWNVAMEERYFTLLDDADADPAVASFVEKRPPALGGLAPDFKVPGDRGYR